MGRSSEPEKGGVDERVEPPFRGQVVLGMDRSCRAAIYAQATIQAAVGVNAEHPHPRPAQVRRRGADAVRGADGQAGGAGV